LRPVEEYRRSLHYAPPDFLSNVLALAILMRLSLLKGAHVDVASSAWQEIRVRSGPNEQTKSVVPHLRRSTACLWTQPFRAGLIFGAGPLGLDCKHRFPMFIPPLTCRQASRLLEMTNWFVQ
jgi:hypothetical protein